MRKYAKGSKRERVVHRHGQPDFFIHIARSSLIQWIMS
ncbi:hypothetical protein B4168_0762 [Anoxybacillus flavithermus]|nr:hypothetical protein B4168_0762 [Anoxybacillus flavithermus]